VRGFGEALAVKCLAIVYPDRWLPLFLYPGENGKRAMMRLDELPVTPMQERGRSRAELAKESNDVLRQLLKPYFGEDSWGPRAVPVVAPAICSHRLTASRSTNHERQQSLRVA
jgi:hypothetical protein